MQGYCESQESWLLSRHCLAQLFQDCIWKASKDQKLDLSLLAMHWPLQITSPLSEPLSASPGEITPVSKMMMLCESFP